MIENELKYVIRVDSQANIEKQCGKPLLLSQGYLPGKARIRSRSKYRGKLKFYFTYKLPVDGVLFEIEKEITRHEFNTLWPHTTKQLTKWRYVKMDGDVQWDIDFFIQAGSGPDNIIYFAMAEAEMPETMIEPPRILKCVSDALVYAVPRERTKEFTSSRVADQEYTSRLIF